MVAEFRHGRGLPPAASTLCIGQSLSKRQCYLRGVVPGGGARRTPLCSRPCLIGDFFAASIIAACELLAMRQLCRKSRVWRREVNSPEALLTSIFTANGLAIALMASGQNGMLFLCSLHAFLAHKRLESHVRPPAQGRDRVGSDSRRHDERFGIVNDERRVFFIRAFD